MRDDDKALKIALASGLPAEFKEALTVGAYYAEYRDAKRYLKHLHDKGFLDDEVYELGLQNIEEYFAIRGLQDFQRRIADDELSNLGAVSNTKGYDFKNDIPLLKPPEERMNTVQELMKDVDSDEDNE